MLRTILYTLTDVTKTVAKMGIARMIFILVALIILFLPMIIGIF